MPETTTSLVTSQRLNELSWGFAPPLMLHAAVKTRIFDSLDGGPQTIAQLQEATGASQRGLRSLLNGLVGLGILMRQGEQYANAPDTAAFLVRGKPGYLGGVLHHLVGQLLANWTQLPEIVRTGRPASTVNQQDDGAEFFAGFVEDLFHLNFPAAQGLAEQLAGRFANLASPVHILDIAAGSGVWSIALARRLAGSRITAVDWPAVAAVTRRVAQEHQLVERLRVIEGDLQSVDFGDGYTIAVLGHILHSEGESRSRRLLGKVFDALAPGGMIAIAEFVPNDDRSGPPGPLIFAVNMLFHTNEGDPFTFPQITPWHREPGFV